LIIVEFRQDKAQSNKVINSYYSNFFIKNSIITGYARNGSQGRVLTGSIRKGLRSYISEYAGEIVCLK
jgi:hypothetical protein